MIPEQERRQFIRLGMRLNVTYKIIGTGKIGTALTTNFSGAGLRFLAEHALAPGTQLDVTLRLPERAEPIKCQGEVVWSEPRRSPDSALPGDTSEVGVRFVQIDPKDRTLIVQCAALYGPPL